MDDTELRQEVKKQFVAMADGMQIVGADKANFIAERMVDMYRIAKDRLGSKQVLQMLYVDNESAPAPLRAVVSAYVQGEIDEDAIAQQLDELAAKTREFVIELGANPDESQHPVAISMEPSSPERKLKSEITAEAMSDTGVVDRDKLFQGLAEVTLMDELAGLAKNIGEREPTHEELFGCLERGWQRVYESNPHLFASEDAYGEWSGKLLAALRNNTKVPASILPIYQGMKEVQAKKR